MPQKNGAKHKLLTPHWRPKIAQFAYIDVGMEMKMGMGMEANRPIMAQKNVCQALEASGIFSR